MRKTFKYPLYPTPAQQTTLKATLEECRWLYNRLLEERKLAWEETETGLSRYQQVNCIPTLKKERPSLATVYSQVLQNVAARVDLAFAGFFRRVAAGEEPAYPRFRGRGRYDSFCYPGSGFSIDGQHVIFSKIGRIRAIIHRPIDGTVKTCCVHRTATGKWYVSFSCDDCAQTSVPPTESAVGIDVGLSTFATMSDGNEIANPRFLRCDERRLQRAQRRREKAPKGSVLRRKRRKVEARVHERIANRRLDFAHQEARKVVSTYGTIAVEDLRVKNMVQNHALAKSIHDAAWAMFIALLAYKAENAGRRYVAVNPAYIGVTPSRLRIWIPLVASSRCTAPYVVANEGMTSCVFTNTGASDGGQDVPAPQCPRFAMRPQSQA
jgi:putative transposase